MRIFTYQTDLCRGFTSFRDGTRKECQQARCVESRDRMNHFTFMCVRKETSEGFFKVQLLIFTFTELTFYSYFNLKATGGGRGSRS